MPLVLASTTVGLLLTLLPVFAQTEGEVSPSEVTATKPAERPIYGPTADFFQRQSSSAVLALSRRIDAFFVDPTADETFNRTRLRLRLGVQYAEGGELSFLQGVALNLDLPETRERLGLFMNRERDDNEHPSTGSIFNDGDEELKFGLRTGVRYTIDKGPYHHLQVQIGTRFLPRFDPFGELRGGLTLPLGNWLFEPTQMLFWRNEIGFGETSRLEFDYPLSEASRLRFRTEGTFSESSAGYEYLQELSYARQLSSRRGIQLALRAMGETRPDADITNYAAIFTGRQLIYSDWLFIELIPRLDFPESENYDPSPAVSLIFETNTGNWKH